MTDDLVAFLRARLEEDEQIARAALGTNEVARPAGKRARWVRRGDQIWSQGRSDVIVVGKTWARPGDHLARHDPARVLAEVTAKRQVIAIYASWEVLARPGAGFPIQHEAETALLALRETLRALVLPYAGHEDFQEEWRV